MSAPPLRHSPLLVLLTAAIASCGSDGKVSSSEGSGGGSTSTSSQGSTSSSTSSASSVTGTGGAMGTGGASSVTGTGGATSTSAAGTGGSPTIRRPFLVGASLRSAEAIPRDDWSREIAATTPALDAATRDLLAKSWLKDALEEHASIAAFARFTMQLLSLGAPADLVERSQRASLDEVRHARACFALAARYAAPGTGAMGPAPLVVHDALGARSLAEIAALAAEEGCVGETLGAALAEEQRTVATDPEVVAALHRLAADEARHAELAWRFVTWAVSLGGPEVARAVADALERAITGTLSAPMRSYDGIDLDAWHAHGRLTCHESRAVAERAIREVVRPCAALVVGARAQRLTAEVALTPALPA